MGVATASLSSHRKEMCLSLHKNGDLSFGFFCTVQPAGLATCPVSSLLMLHFPFVLVLVNVVQSRVTWKEKISMEELPCGGLNENGPCGHLLRRCGLVGGAQHWWCALRFPRTPAIPSVLSDSCLQSETLVLTCFSHHALLCHHRF